MAPKYQEIANQLELLLLQMQADGRTKLPSEQELCREYTCSRQTIRSALAVLSSRGRIISRRGSGSFLADPLPSANRHILWITEDEDAYIYPELISELSSALENKRYNLIVRSTGGRLSGESRALSEALSDLPSAVIIEPVADRIPNPNLPLIEKLHSQGVPVIYLFSAYPVPRDAVLILEDNAGGSSMLVRHLSDSGHRKIAGLFRFDDSRGIERYQGCMQACLDLGLPWDEKSFYLYTSSEQRKLLRGDRTMLNRFVEDCFPGNTAVICQDDIVAYQLTQLLSILGIYAPDQLSIVSFDNSYYASSGKLRLTSLGHGAHAVTEALSDALFSAVSHRHMTPYRLPFTLHIRHSSQGTKNIHTTA